MIISTEAFVSQYFLLLSLSNQSPGKQAHLVAVPAPDRSSLWRTPPSFSAPLHPFLGNFTPLKWGERTMTLQAEYEIVCSASAATSFLSRYFTERE